MSVEVVKRQRSRGCRRYPADDRSRRRLGAIGAVALLLALCARSSPLHAQSDSVDTESEPVASRSDAPLAYIDCNSCDMAHIRREITFVNYVRDPVLAEVYVLVTDERAGSGGRSYSLSFTGRQQFAGLHQTLSYTSSSIDTPAEVRQGLTGMLKLGFVPYVATTALASRLQLFFDAPTEGTETPVTDPWDSWTFQLYSGGNFSMESTQSAWSARYGVYADRVTEEWKLRFRPYFSNNERTFQTDAEEIHSVQKRHGLETFAIRSLGDHWGAGVFGDYVTTTFDNIRNGVAVTPALEYSVFPYDESSRRQITLAYRLGYEFADYYEETIYGKSQEMLLKHALNASIQARQPWGSIASALTASNYLQNREYYRVTFNANTSLRLARGVSLSLGGNFQSIHDQLNLPRGDASLEDVLLQRRSLATSFRASGQLGLTYTFGSIFTNVVNPRL
jgi:hypothetical protein